MTEDLTKRSEKSLHVRSMPGTVYMLLISHKFAWLIALERRQVIALQGNVARSDSDIDLCVRSMPRDETSVGLIAQQGLDAAFAKGGVIHLFVTRTPSTSQLPAPSEFLAGCGHGRYRDRVTQKCRGPADVRR